MANSMTGIVSAKNQYLVKKWGKRIAATESVIGKMGIDRKVALASSLENTNNRMRMVESTQPGSIGQYKRYALDIVNAVVPNLIAYDIVSVQPIDNRVGMVNYISYEYGSNKGGAKAGDMFASSLNMGASNANYSSRTVDNESVNCSATTVSGNLSWLPIIPGTVYFEADGGSVVGKDDGNGNINGTGITSLTIDYTTGAISGTLDKQPTVEPTVTYDYNNEDVPLTNSVPEVNIRIANLPVVAQSRKMKAVYAFDAAYELEKELTFKKVA